MWYWDPLFDSENRFVSEESVNYMWCYQKYRYPLINLVVFLASNLFVSNWIIISLLIYYLKCYLWTPGAIMLLFEGTFGTILHTGDCRLDQECLQSLPEKYLGTKTKKPECSIDYIFLDCTFGRFSKMPSRNYAIRQVICNYA